MNYETLVKLEREVRELRAHLKELKRQGHDVSSDEELLSEVELLLEDARKKLNLDGRNER